jgi:hypothetical protein
MLFVATAPDEGARSIEVKRAIEQNSGLHIYVTETLTGPNCPIKPGTPPPMDIVVLKSVPFDVHVHHDRVRAEECGPAPDAVIACRVAGSGSPGVTKLAAQTGQTIDCDSGQSKPHTGSIVDRGWQLTTVPPGSTTKATLGAQSVGMTFVLDAWGSYQVDLEVRDQSRSGSAIATIDAPPPESGIPIELHWSAFDRNDDASMFPHVELHVADNTGADCSATTAKTWCEVKTTGTVQHAVLKPEPGKSYRTFVTYQDFRLKGSPIACVRTFPKDRPSVATCDETVRAAGTTWEVGAIDEATTTIYDPKKGKPIPYTPPTPDAGAPASPGVERKNPFVPATPDAGAPAAPSGVERKNPF